MKTKKIDPVQAFNFFWYVCANCCKGKNNGKNSGKYAIWNSMNVHQNIANFEILQTLYEPNSGFSLGKQLIQAHWTLNICSWTGKTP